MTLVRLVCEAMIGCDGRCLNDYDKQRTLSSVK